MSDISEEKHETTLLVLKDGALRRSHGRARPRRREGRHQALPAHRRPASQPDRQLTRRRLHQSSELVCSF